MAKARETIVLSREHTQPTLREVSQWSPVYRERKRQDGGTKTNLPLCGQCGGGDKLVLPGAARETVVDVGIAEFETEAHAEARRGELGDALGAARARVPNPTVVGIRTERTIRTEGSGPAVLAASECVEASAGTRFSGGRACGRVVLFDHARDVSRLIQPSTQMAGRERREGGCRQRPVDVHRDCGDALRAIFFSIFIFRRRVLKREEFDTFKIRCAGEAQGKGTGDLRLRQIEDFQAGEPYEMVGQSPGHWLVIGDGGGAHRVIDHSERFEADQGVEPILSLRENSADFTSKLEPGQFGQTGQNARQCPCGGGSVGYSST